MVNQTCTFEHYKEPVEIIRKIDDERIEVVEVGGKVKLAPPG